MSEHHPTPKEWAEAARILRARLLTERPRVFGATKTTCPECGRREMQGVEDIQREFASGACIIVHHNLHGGRCHACGTEILESYEELVLESQGTPLPVPLSAKVTRVGGRNLGTYWPKEIASAMDLHAHDGLKVHLLDEDTMVIERTHDHD